MDPKVGAGLIAAALLVVGGTAIYATTRPSPGNTKQEDDGPKLKVVNRLHVPLRMFLVASDGITKTLLGMVPEQSYIALSSRETRSIKAPGVFLLVNAITKQGEIPYQTMVISEKATKVVIGHVVSEERIKHINPSGTRSKVEGPSYVKIDNQTKLPITLKDLGLVMAGKCRTHRGDEGRNGIPLGTIFYEPLHAPFTLIEIHNTIVYGRIFQYE